jgi:hypothetical protein
MMASFVRIPNRQNAAEVINLDHIVQILLSDDGSHYLVHLSDGQVIPMTAAHVTTMMAGITVQNPNP